MRICLVIAIVLALQACSTPRGFDRGALGAKLQGAEQQVTEQDIKDVLALKPQLPQAFKLAVYFSPPTLNSYYSSQWMWTGDDKDALLRIFDSFKQQQLLGDAFIISEATSQPADLKAIRLLAARYGADAVLVVDGISDVDRYNNYLAMTYLLLVTALFVPGNELDALVMIEAKLWDVRNQYLYLAAAAEGTSRQTRPAAFIEDKPAIALAKQAALGNLASELQTRFKRTLGQQ